MKKLFITCFALVAFGLGGISSAIASADMNTSVQTEYSIKDKKPKKKKKKKKKKDAACEKSSAKSSCCAHAKSGCSKATSDK